MSPKCQHNRGCVSPTTPLKNQKYVTGNIIGSTKQRKTAQRCSVSKLYQLIFTPTVRLGVNHIYQITSSGLANADVYIWCVSDTHIEEAGKVGGLRIQWLSTLFTPFLLSTVINMITRWVCKSDRDTRWNSSCRYSRLWHEAAMSLMMSILLHISYHLGSHFTVWCAGI